MKVMVTGRNHKISGDILLRLNAAGKYDVRECLASKEALFDAVEKEPPLAVIICLAYEDKNSVRVYDVIRDSACFGMMSFIVVANDEDTELFRAGSRLRNVYFVSRPFSIVTLLEKLDEIEQNAGDPDALTDGAAKTTQEVRGDADEKKAGSVGRGSTEDIRDLPLGGSPWDEYPGEVEPWDGSITGDGSSGRVLSEEALRKWGLSSDDSLNTDNDKRKHILVVDDDPQQLAQIKSNLSDFYDVTAVRSGPAAFHYLKKHEVDLILLDYAMPGVDGQMVIKTIRESEEYSHLPVVFLTAASDRETVLKILGMKPQGYLVKPVKKSELVAKIIDVLG